MSRVWVPAPGSPEAVRELAEKCMGWSMSPRGKIWRTPDTTGLYSSGWDHRGMVRNWNPFTNPAHTSMLMDRMRELGYGLYLNTFASVERAVAGFSPDHLSRIGPTSSGDTWMTAVSEAALAAMRSKG